MLRDPLRRWPDFRVAEDYETERIKAPMRDNAGGGRVMARHDPLPEQGAQEIAPRLPS